MVWAAQLLENPPCWIVQNTSRCENSDRAGQRRLALQRTALPGSTMLASWSWSWWSVPLPTWRKVFFRVDVNPGAGLIGDTRLFDDGGPISDQPGRDASLV